ncbi:MAG: AzlC family ABC transporter permease [Thermoleophilaceae bacterium]
MPDAPNRSDAAVRASLRAGLRAGVPFALAGGLLSLSFGVLAESAGLGAPAAILMAAIVFAGSAQFAAVGIIAAGGGIGTAVVVATLVNSRFLPMGVALAPYLSGGRLRRAIQGQAVVDASWALARDAEGHFDRHFLFGCTAVQYVTWVPGTVVGALMGGGLIDPDALGLDAIFPAVFLVLLISELGGLRNRGVALGGALIAIALVPLAPPGVPVVAASLAALYGLRGRDR